MANDQTSTEGNTMTARSDCPAKREGFLCTRAKGHRGRHQAKGIDGTVLRTWAPAKPVTAREDVQRPAVTPAHAVLADVPDNGSGPRVHWHGQAGTGKPQQRMGQQLPLHRIQGSWVYATADWDQVTCRLCLRSRDAIEAFEPTAAEADAATVAYAQAEDDEAAKLREGLDRFGRRLGAAILKIEAEDAEVVDDAADEQDNPDLHMAGPDAPEPPARFDLDALVAAAEDQETAAQEKRERWAGLDANTKESRQLDREVAMHEKAAAYLREAYEAEQVKPAIVRLTAFARQWPTGTHSSDTIYATAWMENDPETGERVERQAAVLNSDLLLVLEFARKAAGL